jgi:UDP-GlcNAc:undecaprenyl-phosphate GlcNAc-1-phosphate transferase
MTGLGIFLISFLASYFGTLLLLRIPVKSRFVDVPGDRSSHDAAKPRFGGIAVVTAFFLGFGALLAARPEARGLLPLLPCGALIFAAGVLDDWRGLPVAVRLAAQLAAAIAVVATGNIVETVFIPLAGTIELDVLAVPFTILFILASINFYNFIDGIDGLAAGTAAITAGFLALIAHMLGHGALALAALAAAGASLGFLQFNFPPSRLFMGDGGSTFLGFFFAFFAIAGNRVVPELPFFITVLLLSSLYLDAGVTLLRRLFKGEKIFQPHRTHYYQRLLALGFNHKQVTALEYSLTVLLGTSAVIFFKAGGFFPVFLCLCWLLVFTSMMLKVRGLERGDRLFWERRTVLVMAADIFLVAAAYFAAFFLRLGFQFSGDHWDAVARAFPIVLVVRSSCFYAFGLYRGVWKYTSTPDIVKIIKAVTVGSGVIMMLLVFFYRFEAFPRSMFVMEFFLLILGLAGARFASRLFHEFGKDVSVTNAARVAIVGAGDAGEGLLREIRSTEGKRSSIVCFIDDDKGKDGLTLQGVPITGPIENLAEICRAYRADTVLVAAGDASGPAAETALREARNAGLRVETRGRETAGTVGSAAAESTDALLERISRTLGRPRASDPSGAAVRAYRGKRVLITNGGEQIGPALVRVLVSAGAAVTVHVAAPRDAERFGGTAEKRLVLRAGALDRENEFVSLVEAAAPEVVFHVLPLRARGIANEADYMWRRNVRGCEALCAALARSKAESLVLVRLWDESRLDEPWALMAALGEALVLNHPALTRVSPKSARVPPVLTRDAVARLAGSLASAGAPDERFAMTEDEAAAFVLGVGALHAGRQILVPASAEFFAASDVTGAIAGTSVGSLDAAAHSDGERRAHGGSRPLFPNEIPRPSVVPGAEQVVSPLVPAGPPVLDLVAEPARLGRERIDDCFKALKTELFAGEGAVRSAGPRSE